MENKTYTHPFDIPLGAILGPNKVYGSNRRIMQRTVVRDDNMEPVAIRFVCNDTHNIDAAWEVVEVPAYDFRMTVTLDALSRR